jgi:hypothetical protein
VVELGGSIPATILPFSEEKIKDIEHIYSDPAQNFSSPAF